MKKSAHMEHLMDHELLSAGHERILLRRSRCEDRLVARRAREQLVRHNMRLVVGAAGRFYLPHGMDREDLIQAGVAGLLRAIDKFDEGRGTRFSTYAVPWIRQSIGRQIENTGSLVRLPIALQAEMARLRRAEAALSSTLGRLPTGEEAAWEAGLSAEKLEVLGHARQVSSHAASLDAATEETDALFERLAAADPEPGEHTAAAEERAFQAAALRDAINALPEEQARVLTLRFGLDGEGLTLAATGEILGKSHEYIRQREKAALDNLRRHLRLMRPLCREVA